MPLVGAPARQPTAARTLVFESCQMMSEMKLSNSSGSPGCRTRDQFVPPSVERYRPLFVATSTVVPAPLVMILNTVLRSKVEPPTFFHEVPPSVVLNTPSP